MKNDCSMRTSRVENRLALCITVADISTIIRQATTGKTNSPDLFTVMQIWGYDRTVQRIRTVMNEL